MAALVALLGSALDAQGSDTLLKRGARVEMWSVEARYSGRSGWYTSRSSDSLYFQLKTPFSERAGRVDSVIALAHVDKLMVRVPTGRTWIKGLRRGVALGGFLGGLGGAIWGVHDQRRHCEATCDPFLGRMLWMIVYGLPSAVVGAGSFGVVGFLYGAATSSTLVAVSVKAP